MGGGGKVHMPHWKSQQIHGVRQLEEVQEFLKKHNLKDPWIRDEAYKFKNHRIYFRNLIYPIPIMIGVALGLGVVYYMEKTDKSKKCPPFHLT